MASKTISNGDSTGKKTSKFKEIVKTQVKFYDNQYFQVFHKKFKICFQHLVFLEMSFFRRYLKQWHRIMQYDLNNLGTKSFGFLLN